MASLRRRIILSFAVCLGIFLIFVSVIIVSGFTAALRGWQNASEERYAASVVRAAEKLFESSIDVSDEEIIRVLEPYLNERFALALISAADRRIIVSHNITFPPPFLRNHAEFPQNRRARRGSGADNAMLRDREVQTAEITGHRYVLPRPGGNSEIPRWAFPVLKNGEPQTFLWVRSMQFADGDTINQHLIKNILLILFLGIIVSFAVAMLFTSVISGKITKEASAVSAGLEKIALGSRDVVFPESKLNEISSIRKSASILQETLSKEENAKKQWTQDIAHDLRTPVTAIKAQLEAMIDGVLLPENARLKNLLMELNRLETLVEDINRLTKIESSEINLSYEEIESDTLVAVIKERFWLQAEEKKIKLIIRADSFAINCDVNNFTRALSNLVQNSIQYSPHESEVNIRFCKEETQAVFAIENRGNIPEEEKEKIFDRLYRGEFGRSTQGSGLGLTIAKAVIEKHGGTISIYNVRENETESIVFVAKVPLI
ncbi:MAG: HAMP domain-containing histidine kinase [Spirochaetes bacterium]|nr:HAMP domain-containing histidine kinase [Spirochaetota bacterium]